MYQGPAGVVVGVVPEPLGPSVGAVDASLGFPPTPAVDGPSGLGTLRAFEGSQDFGISLWVWIVELSALALSGLVVSLGVWVVSAGIDSQGVDAGVGAAC